MNMILASLSSVLIMMAISGHASDVEKAVISKPREASCCNAHETKVPRTSDNQIDWGAFRVSLRDSDIAHFHKRAKELLNDEPLWNRLGQKYKGPFEAASDDFEYQCERLVGHKATVAVVVPIKKRDFHAWFVKIVFRQYFKDDPAKEVESIELSFWP